MATTIQSVQNRTQKAQRRKEELAKRIVNSQYFFIALLIHIIALLLWGSHVIFEAYRDRILEAQTMVAPKHIPPPVVPPSGGSQMEKSFDVQVSAPKTTELLRAITVNSPTASFSVVAPEMPATVAMETGGIGQLGGIGNGSGSGTGNGSGVGVSRSLFGTEVVGEKLAVVLDVSGSMKSILPEVAREVQKTFPEAVIYFAVGCEFKGKPRKGPKKEQLLATIKEVGFKNAQISEVFFAMDEAIVAILDNGGVDALWLFADYQDGVKASNLDIVANKISSHKVKVYMHSVEREPDPMLVALTTKTGGSYKVQSLKGKK
jgi:hypothetical protein